MHVPVPVPDSQYTIQNKGGCGCACHAAAAGHGAGGGAEEPHVRTDTMFPWHSDTVYAGGGAKLKRPVNHGYILLREDGGLDVCPDDDYYSGELDAKEAIKLARAILMQNQKVNM